MYKISISLCNGSAWYIWATSPCSFLSLILLHAKTKHASFAPAFAYCFRARWPLYPSCNKCVCINRTQSYTWPLYATCIAYLYKLSNALPIARRGARFLLVYFIDVSKASKISLYEYILNHKVLDLIEHYIYLWFCAYVHPRSFESFEFQDLKIENIILLHLNNFRWKSCQLESFKLSSSKVSI
jgi:hypothetical protein